MATSVTSLVKPLKLEVISANGDITDMTPTETSPTADYLNAKGIAFRSSLTTYIDSTTANAIQFQDSVVTSLITLDQLRTASSNIFSNATNNFASTTVQTAIEEVQNGIIHIFGAGTDGVVALTSGITTLTRTMYYDSLTMSGTASIIPNGFKVFVKNTLTLSGSAQISSNGTNGTSAIGNALGAGGIAINGFEYGASQAGGSGAAVAADAASLASINGYGGSGGNGGSGGGNTPAATGGLLVYYPEHTIRMDHYLIASFYKGAGGGGAGGNGGAQPLFATAGAGGGGGAGGGVVMVFSKNLNNTSSLGFTAKGGNGGNGGNASGGNGGGGGGAGGGGGGFLYLITYDITSNTNFSVSGGLGGTAGTGTGTGVAGVSGSVGSNGHYVIHTIQTNTWTTS